MHGDTRQTEAQKGADLPAHLVSLDGGEWAIWRWVGLRSAGFSHDDLRPLVAPACVAAAEDYLALERQEQLASDARAAAHTAFERAYQEATRQNLRTLHQIASAPAFREALIWQNRRALHTGVDPLLAVSPDLAVRASKYRAKEFLVASYAQRYCTKNDTIGFYGPVGWATCTDTGPLLTVRPGPTLLAMRTVYFEGWCIDALAAHLASIEALQPWLIPRLLPHLWFDGTRLQIPLGTTLELRPDHAAVLAACDGVRCAQQVAQALLDAHTPGIQDEANVYAILRDLRTRRRIAWTLEVSIERKNPDQRLRARLALIGDQELRTSALSALETLENCRNALSDARGDVARLDQAMETLETTFASLTGYEATRHAGTTYGGRTLVYEDCQRDVQVEIGPELLSTLGPPLSLLLTSARWLTYEAAVLYQRALQEIYQELSARKQMAAVPLSDFWLYAYTLLFDRNHPLLTTLREHFQQRWLALLAPDLEQKRLVYQVADLQQPVSATFAAPRPGWRGAYYHSPDLMLATPSLERLRQGDYCYVLGELHTGANTLRADLFVAQHPHPEDLEAAVRSDCLDALVFPVYSRENKGLTTRISNAFVRPHDWRLLYAVDSCEVPASQALPVSRLEVELEGERLIVYTRDRQQRWDLVDLLGDLLMIQIVQQFSLFPAACHIPRISFDRLVVQREAWCFTPQEITFAPLSSESERFLEARRWMHKHHLPHHVFMKVPTEMKPFYVDFDSLASIDVCARILRRIPEDQGIITVSEMLPDLHETWLIDQQHRPYTSELRFVAVDRRAC